MVEKYERFCYNSANNTKWMEIEELRSWITKNHDLIGKYNKNATIFVYGWIWFISFKLILKLKTHMMLILFCTKD